MFGLRKKKETNWDEQLLDWTRQAFLDVENSPLSELPIVCMKKYSGEFGIITQEHIRNNIYSIMLNEDASVGDYDSLEGMLADGWVVD